MKHKRIVAASLIAVPVIAGVAAYLVRQNQADSASQTEIPTAIPSAPAAAEPSESNAAGMHLRAPHTPQAEPTLKQPSQTGEEKSEDGPAYVKDVDSASFPQIERHLVASDAKSLPNEDSADISPNGRFAPPLMLTYLGGLGAGGGHRTSNHQGPSVSESGSPNNIPSNGGATDSKNVPSPSSLQGPSHDEHHDSQPHQGDDGDGTFVDNSSHDANIPSHHDDSVPTDDHPIPPLAFNDEPKNEHPVQVPEPGTLGLLGLGLLGLARRRKVQK